MKPNHFQVKTFSLRISFIYFFFFFLLANITVVLLANTTARGKQKRYKRKTNKTKLCFCKWELWKWPSFLAKPSWIDCNSANTRVWEKIRKKYIGKLVIVSGIFLRCDLVKMKWQRQFDTETILINQFFLTSFIYIFFPYLIWKMNETESLIRYVNEMNDRERFRRQAKDKLLEKNGENVNVKCFASSLGFECGAAMM